MFDCRNVPSEHGAQGDIGVLPAVVRSWPILEGSKAASCARLVTTLQGVFCANVWSPRGHWEKCRGVWCGSCFDPVNEDGFPIRVPINDGAEAVLVNVKYEGRFMCARNGDYLMTRF